MISKIIPNGLFLGALASSGLLAFTTLLGTAGFKALDSLSALVRSYRAELIEYVKHLSLIEDTVDKLSSDHDKMRTLNEKFEELKKNLLLIILA